MTTEGDTAPRKSVTFPTKVHVTVLPRGCGHPLGARASSPVRKEGKGWAGGPWRWRQGALGTVEGATVLRNGFRIVASGTCGCLYTRYLSPETYLVPRMVRVLPKALPLRARVWGITEGWQGPGVVLVRASSPAIRLRSHIVLPGANHPTDEKKE